jgi:hypothetical protein
MTTSFLKNLFQQFATLLLIAVFALAGCATGARTSYHTFSFDGWNDNWAKTVDLLEYDYGGAHSMVQRKAESEENTLGYRTSINATMANGEYLYVKWRIKSTGEVIESRVDLRGRLPDNMFDQGVTFVIDEKQLYVYLITAEKKKYMSPPVLRTSRSNHYVSYEIFPTNTFKK